ncbi:MAG TPA: glycosyltransferase family 2 protein [Caulobacteraceae bacterium]
MKFSIVTVSFNQAAYLEDAIRSVLDQDYPNLEYIVVDPGSTDGSREIIERYRDRIDKIIYKPDSGAAEGLNNGFAVASGDIYGFLNSDDVMLPGALSRAAEAFRAHPKADFIIGHTKLIDAEGKWVRNSYSDAFNRKAFAYQACVICQQSTFFKAEIFKRSRGFNPGNKIAWDAELFLDLLEDAKRPILVDAFLSAFRVHAEGITGAAKMRPLLINFERSKFQRIMGRPWRWWDNAVAVAYLVRKYLLEPRSFWHRLRYGSIYGRYSRKALKKRSRS